MKRVIVIGSGRSGIAAAQFLASTGVEVLLNDKNPTLDPTVLQELNKAGVCTHLGDHPVDLLDGCSEMVLSPGVPLSLPIIQEAFKRGISVIGELELGHRAMRSKNDGSMILAITGTNGKSTTTDLTTHLLKCAGIKAITCGNFGLPLTQAQRTAEPGTRFVLECSSYQLESIQDFYAEGAVLLNLTPDHLARHSTMEGYLEAKLRVFQKQLPQHLCLINQSTPLPLPVPGTGTRAAFGWSDPGGPGCWCDEHGRIHLRDLQNRHIELIESQRLRIPGPHNVENAMAACMLALHGGASLEAICEGLQSYPGLAHRIAFVGEREGIKVYNDSKGTNVDATLTAVHALPGPLVLILGGEDKGSSYKPLIDALTGKLRKLIFLGDAIPQLERDLGHLPHDSIQPFDAAIEQALEIAKPGDQVLLSPACASFDQFKNFEVRGEHFEALIRAWMAKG